MGLDPVTATIGAAVVGGGGQIASSIIQSRAAGKAADKSLQAAREAIAAQERGAERGFDIFQQEADRARGFVREQNALATKELEPFRELGLRNLERVEGFLDPNSEANQADRDVFTKAQGRLLAARGLSGSGNELAGLAEFITGQGANRRNLAKGLLGIGQGASQGIAGLQSSLGTNLANISSGLGQTGAGIFSNLGQGQAGALQAGTQQANLANIAQGQARAQGVAGVSNAFQTGLAGLSDVFERRRQEKRFDDLFDRLSPSSRPRISTTGGRGRA